MTRKTTPPARKTAKKAVKRRSPPHQRNSAKGINTRARILDQAAELFSQHSYADASLNDLAAACGLSKAALFTHFDNKRQIYVESVNRVFASALDTYREPLDAKTAQARLRHYLNWIFPVMSDNRLMCRLTIRMVLDRDIDLARDLLPGAFGRTHQLFMKLVADTRPKKDPQIVVFFAYAILTLNDELLEFATLWLKDTRTLLGGEKSAAALEALILSW